MHNLCNNLSNSIQIQGIIFSFQVLNCILQCAGHLGLAWSLLQISPPSQRASSFTKMQVLFLPTSQTCRWERQVWPLSVFSILCCDKQQRDPAPCILAQRLKGVKQEGGVRGTYGAHEWPSRIFLLCFYLLQFRLTQFLDLSHRGVVRPGCRGNRTRHVNE